MSKIGYRFLVLLLLLPWVARPALAQDPPDGPVFVVISLTDTFDLTGLKANGKQAGSGTITVMIGTLTSGGDGSTDTTFTAADLATIPLPVDKDGNPLDIAQLSDNQATIFGSFEAYNLSGDLEPHVVTTLGVDIDPNIQVAVVAAAAALQSAIADDPFMTTGEIADIVFQELPSNTGLSLDDVAAAIFDTEETLAYDNSGEVALVESEGELFPHAPGSGALFTYAYSFDEDGDYSSDFCRVVEIEVSESAVDLKKQGVLPATILSDKGFDAADVASVTLLGVAPESSSLSDKNGDGLDDLVVKFDVPSLVEAGLSKTTKTVTLNGELDDGTCIVGTSAINTK